MRAIMVMFDTLCRRFMPPYGNDWVIAPNFRRLAARTVQFDNCYIGSMPCMPARREIHTGRSNFLHRSWGPLEPFDDSMPELLGAYGVHTHKVTDHYHYWEDGGATYHNRYRSFEFVRGQEGDPHIGWAGPIAPEPHLPDWSNWDRRGRDWRMRAQDWINRQHQRSEDQQPQHITFSKGIDFIRRNKDFDRWFCQIETFDPHEPFFSQPAYHDLYPHDWKGPTFDWPSYQRLVEDGAAVEHIRCVFAALITYCDRQLGRFLDVMDELDLWKDTLLIVNTDHGYLMGEHDWWAKCRMPFWQEIAHIPLWIWDPRCAKRGERRQALVQTADLAPTLLDYFGAAIPGDMQGRPLRAAIDRDERVRDAGLYGIHGGHVNVTDGRYVYMRGPASPDNGPLYEYTVMPTHMAQRFSVDELRQWDRHPGFAFTKGCPVMRIPARATWIDAKELHQTRLFDLETDYDQRRQLDDARIEARMTDHLVRLMREADAPPEQFQRLGLPM